MRILITGGAGLLGIIVCLTFLQDAFEVRVLDVNIHRTRKSIKKLGGKAEIMWGDITRPHSVRQAMEEVDAVVHMAAILPPVSEERPELATSVNTGGTQNIINLIKERGGHIPFVYTSSIAVFGPTPDTNEPLDPEKDVPRPKGVYAETKFQGESMIRESGVDYVILRLASHWHNFIFSRSDLQYMFRRPMDNRIEFCHPNDTALAILNAIKNFDAVKGNTLVISGGPNCRMLHKDRVSAIMRVLGLPLPPAKKFSDAPASTIWYDTRKSQRLLHFQQRTFNDCVEDYRKELASRYSPIFLPLMRYFVGPAFGKLIVRII